MDMDYIEIRYAAPGPVGLDIYKWRCQCGHEMTTTERWPPIQCPTCKWVDGMWKWLRPDEG